MRSISFVFIYSLILFFLTGCFASKQGVKTSPESVHEDQILFLVFEIRKNGNEKEIHLSEKIQTPGKLKENRFENEEPKSGDITCLFLDKKGSIIQEIFISNPLHQHLEYFDENGNGAIKEVLLEKNTFQLRVQHHPETVLLRIEELLAENEKRKIADFKL